METSNLKEEIVGLLDVILEQTEEIHKHTGPIPKIEIDIVLANIRELYERFIILEKKYAVALPAEKKEKAITIKATEPVIEKAPEPVPEKPAVVMKVTEPIVEVMEEPKKETTEVVAPVKKVKQKSAAPDLFDLPAVETKMTVKEEKKSLNDLLSETHKEDKSVAARIKKNPIKDIKSAIGINEKFKLINELFEGNLKRYNECIDGLNQQESLEDADNYMFLLQEEFHWDKKGEAYMELYDLILRRYQS